LSGLGAIGGAVAVRSAAEQNSSRYGGGIFTHAATTGLLAGTGLRQVADRSLGMTAALRRAPQ
jgi:hypothetical protein